MKRKCSLQRVLWSTGQVEVSIDGSRVYMTSVLWPSQLRTRFWHSPTFIHTPLLDNPARAPQ